MKIQTQCRDNCIAVKFLADKGEGGYAFNKLWELAREKFGEHCHIAIYFSQESDESPKDMLMATVQEYSANKKHLKRKCPCGLYV